METKLTRKFCQLLKQHNCRVYVLSASQRQSRGIPDRFVAHNWWCGFIEFKGPGTPLTKLQEQFCHDANRDGRVKAVICRFLTDEVFPVEIMIHESKKSQFGSISEILRYLRG